MMEIKIWLFIVLLLVCVLVGAIASFIVTRILFQRQLEKNPPVNRNMIRAMFMQMGRKPSEADINKVMATMNVKPESSKKPTKKAKK
ncbi:MAG: YneF family protein [Bacilli bacterium]|nr:YneF family protein [Bacilli bacterium]